jgi:hypothetical protein
MRRLRHFEQKQGYALFCPVGKLSFDEMAELFSQTVIHCRKHKIGKLLFDSTRLPQFQPPGISKEFNLAAQIAAASASLVKIAHVDTRKWIHWGEFTVIVANNRGLNIENFQSASAALEWLLKPSETSIKPTKSA